jgi:hypothetical protein
MTAISLFGQAKASFFPMPFASSPDSAPDRHPLSSAPLDHS